MLASTAYDYLKAVKAQEIELGAVDMATFGLNLDGVYIYKNVNTDSQFMSLERIASGFCKVVADYYPMLVGRPAVSKNGKGVMIVDPANLCMPDIAELTVTHPAEAFFETRDNVDQAKDTVKFFNLRKFYRDSGVSRLPQATYNRDNAAAIVRVIRFAGSDYVALYISMSHVLFDGLGATMFFNNWAECARNLDNPSHTLQNPPVNDRKIVTNYFDTVTAVEPPHTKHLKEQSTVSIMPTPDNFAPILIATPGNPAFEEQHLLHFTLDKLEQVRQDIDKTQTTNLTLAVLLSKVVLQAGIQAFNSMPKWSYVMFPYDCRKSAGIPTEYSGNLSFSAIAPLESQAVLDGSGKELAQAIKEHCSKTSGEYAKSTIDTIENEIGVLFQAGASLCNSANSSYVGLTNLRYMPLYSIDFGYGGPEILSCDYFTGEGMSRIYANKQDGGIDLVINIKDNMFEYLKTSEELLKYADVIF
ncbi:hypothetical protein IWW55_000033 [Coemansia sp. RSA 2706]|nr:hypothetical protein IWW55_000033 [Coemansia sp. RSA 2706]KAJ2315789.1 hypothetical protein IWW54_000030 [Coemansia sp. RSA 2705]KAJ2322494.1 hypothetical protein IWW52_000029 [Coemansia sp. RSA 2704]KAJ2330274.1 hypothetical protein IWW51_000029 [Coemansia sp. RSA 2702]KAJ2740019.1 hypothetical protein H4R23_000013 [Coemansia sp. Cherry 401B]